FKKEENAVWISIKADEEFLDYVIRKGSITIDGVSLTVAYVDKKILKVSIIPHTKDNTTLLGKKVGDLVNLESDIIGKYVKRFISLSNQSDEKNDKKSNIDLDFLIKNGF
ncbi:MAG: riboflavin synthase, partial [Intestinibacter sp.]